MLPNENPGAIWYSIWSRDGIVDVYTNANFQDIDTYSNQEMILEQEQEQFPGYVDDYRWYFAAPFPGVQLVILSWCWTAGIHPRPLNPVFFHRGIGCRQHDLYDLWESLKLHEIAIDLPSGYD